MPASHLSPTTLPEAPSLNNENAAVHCAYRLIGQLRPPSLAQSPLPSATPTGRGRQEPERKARPLRAAASLATQHA